MRHLISLKEQSKKDLINIINLAGKLKAQKNKSGQKKLLGNKTVIMLFEKTSTRTRLSFEQAVFELGGHPVFLAAKNTQFSIGVDFWDEMKAVMGYGDALVYRALKAQSVIDAASINLIPVIDACSEKYHPCQTLGDILTMSEEAGGLGKINKIVWLGIENNVSNTLKLACAKLGLNLTLLSPQANINSIDENLNDMVKNSGYITYTNNIKKGLKDADFIHTDSWIDMEYFQNGKVKPEYLDEYKKRKKLFMPFQLSAKLIDTYAPKARIMHCMPCHIGNEITREAVDHKNSLIFAQAKNRTHIQKAILLWLLRQNYETD